MGLFDRWRARKRQGSAREALERGDFRGAIGALSELVQLRPRWPEGQYQYGAVLLASADSNLGRATDAELRARQSSELATEALRALNRALHYQEHYPEAHNDRGRALVKLDRLTEAEAAFQSALDQMPGYESATYNQRWVRGQMRRLRSLEIEGADHEIMRELREFTLHPG